MKLPSCRGRWSKSRDRRPPSPCYDDVLFYFLFLGRRRGGRREQCSPCYRRHTFLLFVFGTMTVFTHCQKVLTFSWKLCGKLCTLCSGVQYVCTVRRAEEATGGRSSLMQRLARHTCPRRSQLSSCCSSSFRIRIPRNCVSFLHTSIVSRPTPPLPPQAVPPHASPNPSAPSPPHSACPRS